MRGSPEQLPPSAPPDSPVRYKLQGAGRLWQAFVSSARGIKGAFREEEAFRQELLFACVALPLALWLGRTGVERALLAAPVLLILIVELLNSAIEATVDRIGLERNALAGLAKDVSSAAVMGSFILLGLVWLLVLSGR